MTGRLALFRTLLSACPTWLTLCGTTDPVVAGAQVFSEQAPIAASLPIIVANITSEARQMGTSGGYITNGKINGCIYLARTSPASAAREALDVTLQSLEGDIMGLQGMPRGSGLDSHLLVRDFAFDHPSPSDPVKDDEAGSRLWHAIQFSGTWGPE